MENLQINIAVFSLRLLPFRYDVELRKTLNNINSQIKLQEALSQISNMIFSKKPIKLVLPKSIIKEERKE